MESEREKERETGRGGERKCSISLAVPASSAKIKGVI